MNDCFQRPTPSQVWLHLYRCDCRKVWENSSQHTHDIITVCMILFSIFTEYMPRFTKPKKCGLCIWETCPIHDRDLSPKREQCTSQSPVTFTTTAPPQDVHHSRDNHSDCPSDWWASLTTTHDSPAFHHSAEVLGNSCIHCSGIYSVHLCSKQFWNNALVSLNDHQ